MIELERFNEVLDTFEGGYEELDRIVEVYVKDDFTLHDLVEFVCEYYYDLWWNSFYELEQTMTRHLTK